VSWRIWSSREYFPTMSRSWSRQRL
jgi:hypothetical protein